MQNNEIIKPAKYFSELEKSILLALVEKYKYVLECKKSDARTIALKQRTWQALAHEYNSQPSVSLRDFKQLKKCWENIKARTKKIMAHERREKVKRSVSPLLSTHVLGKEKIASMLPEQLYFLQSPPEEEPEYHPDGAAQGMGPPGQRARSRRAPAARLRVTVSAFRGCLSKRSSQVKPDSSPFTVPRFCRTAKSEEVQNSQRTC